jgi:hypothetical protein
VVVKQTLEVGFIFKTKKRMLPAPDSWRESVKLASYCPLCETRYNPMHAQVIGEEGETHLLYIRCRKCASSILALVLVNEIGVSSVGLVTDLTLEDVVHFRHARRLSIDDVLRTHEWLSHHGWVTHLIPPSAKTSVRKKRSET